MEVLGLDEDVHYQIAKLASARLCSTSLGQVNLQNEIEAEVSIVGV